MLVLQRRRFSWGSVRISQTRQFLSDGRNLDLKVDLSANQTIEPGFEFECFLIVLGHMSDQAKLIGTRVNFRVAKEAYRL